MVHSLFEYAGFACRLAADLQRGDSSGGHAEGVNGAKLAYHNQLGHVQLTTYKGHA